jgi:hypothetical protein
MLTIKVIQYTTSDVKGGISTDKSDKEQDQQKTIIAVTYTTGCKAYIRRNRKTKTTLIGDSCEGK